MCPPRIELGLSFDSKLKVWRNPTLLSRAQLFILSARWDLNPYALRRRILSPPSLPKFLHQPLVSEEGLEPSSLWAADFESAASTDCATHRGGPQYSRFQQTYFWLATSVSVCFFQRGLSHIPDFELQALLSFFTFTLGSLSLQRPRTLGSIRSPFQVLAFVLTSRFRMSGAQRDGYLF